MNTHKLFCDRKTDTTSLIHHTTRQIILKKTIKDATLLFMRNSNACVFYSQFKFVLTHFSIDVHVNGNSSIFMSKLKCVRQKIENDLFKFVLIKECFEFGD